MRVKTNLTLRPDIKERAIKFAEDNNFSLSEFVEDLLAEFLTKSKKATGRPTTPAPLALLSMGS